MTTSPYDNLPVGNRPFNITSAEENTSAETVKNAAENSVPTSSEKIGDNSKKLKSSYPDNTGYEEVALPETPDTLDITQGSKNSSQYTGEVFITDNATDVYNSTSDITSLSGKTDDTSNSDHNSTYQDVSLPVETGNNTFSGASSPVESDNSSNGTYLMQSTLPKPASPDKSNPSKSTTSTKTATPLHSANLTRTEPMTKPPRYSKLPIQNRCATREFILPFEESIIVPDTLPDMQEIFFTEGHVSLSQNKTSYEASDILSAEITLYTVYRPGNDAESPVDVVKSSISVKTAKCWGSSENSLFKVNASLKSSSAEMINERKFITRGEVSLLITEISKKELNVFKEIDDPCLVKQSSTVTATALSFETEEITDITQEIKISDEQTSPVKILKKNISITEAHKQTASGKLVVNAIVKTNILYTGLHDGEIKLCNITDKTDFTQFIPLKKETEVSLIKTSFNSDGLDITIDDNSKFMLKGQVRTSIQGYENREIPVISDAYHKEKDLEFDISHTPLFSVATTSSGEISAREIINAENSTYRPERLICSSLQSGSISCHPEGSRIIIDGKMPVKTLALTEDGKPFTIEGSIPLRGAIDADISETPSHIDLWTSVKELWIDSINSRQIEINLTLSINIWVNIQQRFSTLENLRFIENPVSGKRVSMAVYVTGKGDSLWSIGKKYKGDMDAIARFNQIDPSLPLPEGTKLLITK